MAARVVDNTARVKAALAAEYRRRVRACLVLLANHAKMLVNKEGSTRVVTRDSGDRFKSVKLRYNTNPSKPGQPPHKQTGRLLASIAWEAEGLVGRVGTNVDYGRFLELGTSRMSARPWLRRALAECEPQIRAIMREPIRLVG